MLLRGGIFYVPPSRIPLLTLDWKCSYLVVLYPALHIGIQCNLLGGVLIFCAVLRAKRERVGFNSGRSKIENVNSIASRLVMTQVSKRFIAIVERGSAVALRYSRLPRYARVWRHVLLPL